jgi:hypothetical protein
VLHDQIRNDLRSGRIGLAQNHLPANTRIEDVSARDVIDATQPVDGRIAALGREALHEGRVAVFTLAAGAGSRWTRGAGTVKGLHPFCRLAGRHRSFLEVHLAKSRRAAEQSGNALPHVVSTSYLTHEAIHKALEREENYDYPGPILLSPGSTIGLRMVPMVRDLRFLWEEMPQQLLDDQAQKVRESLRAALIEWSRRSGEGSDYTENAPTQCLHPVGHWYEFPNMLKNGTLLRLLELRPNLTTLMMHNVDTAGADPDPGILGLHLASGVAMSTEVTTRCIHDRGGGLARIDGRVRLVEGMALPREEIEFELSYYNSATYWLEIDGVLALFGLQRSDITDARRVARAVREMGSRMPTYVTLKDVKKRWGKGQEDVYPTSQFEKLWGDMTALPELPCQYLVVSRFRGQQLKEVAQLDGWVRDGSAAYVEALGTWSSP